MVNVNALKDTINVQELASLIAKQMKSLMKIVDVNAKKGIRLAEENV